MVKVAIFPFEDLFYEYKFQSRRNISSLLLLKYPSFFRRLIFIFESKTGRYLLGIPIALFILLFKIYLSAFWNYILIGNGRSRQLLQSKLGRHAYILSKLPFRKENNFALFSKLKREDFQIIIYYSTKDIPMQDEKIKSFKSRLETLKSVFDIFQIIHIESEKNVDEIIDKYDAISEKVIFISNSKLHKKNQ